MYCVKDALEKSATLSTGQLILRMSLLLQVIRGSYLSTFKVVLKLRLPLIQEYYCEIVNKSEWFSLTVIWHTVEKINILFLRLRHCLIILSVMRKIIIYSFITWPYPQSKYKVFYRKFLNFKVTVYFEHCSSSVLQGKKYHTKDTECTIRLLFTL